MLNKHIIRFRICTSKLKEIYHKRKLPNVIITGKLGFFLIRQISNKTVIMYNLSQPNVYRISR